MNELLTLPAFELARRIRERVVSSMEVVQAHVTRLRAVNDVINAVTRERYDAALAEARAADARLEQAGSSGDLPPLLGVPFTVKEMISLQGMPHTFGSRIRAERLAESDATIVRRLRGAGAIPLAVTNVPEWGFWFETDNLVFGRTNNPYDPARISGGSSGGEAAAVGAGGAPFGIGSDIGGSVRMPAAFCGVFGHKPTHGLLPLTGHYPVYEGGPDATLPKRIPWLTPGPIARSARDLMPLLRIMAGPDGVDPNAEDLTLGDPAAVEWRGRRILLLRDPRICGAFRATREVRAAAASAAAALARRGADVRELPRGFFRGALRIWFAALHSTATMPLARLIGGGTPPVLALELARLLLRRPRFTFPAIMFALMDKVQHTSEAQTRALLEAGRRMGARLDEALGPDGLLLMPAHPRAAPRHHAPYLRPFDFVFTAVFNFLRVPVTAIPVGLDAHGLPLSVQAAARRGNDHLTVAAALALEEDLGGWRPPRRLEALG